MEPPVQPRRNMGRPLRFVPSRETLVAVAWRVVQGRFLLRPSRELNEAVLATCGRAQRRCRVRICGLAVLSNHLHLLLVVDDAEEVARFMQHLGANLARAVNRLTGWSGPVFHGRYSMIVVTDEEAAQVERLRYVLAQGCKEHLVERPRDWPGVHCVRALVEGAPLAGRWPDRTAERRIRCRAEGPGAQDRAEEVVLTPLPCWRHLPPETYRHRVMELVEEIERVAAAERARDRIRVLGVSAILALDPQHRPSKVAKSLAPLVHAASRAARLAFREAYRRFVAAFREAAAAFRRGDRSAVFPTGSFPPAPPFVSG